MLYVQYMLSRPLLAYSLQDRTWEHDGTGSIQKQMGQILIGTGFSPILPFRLFRRWLCGKAACL